MMSIPTVFDAPVERLSKMNQFPIDPNWPSFRLDWPLVEGRPQSAPLLII